MNSFTDTISQFLLSPHASSLSYLAGQYVQVAHPDKSFSALSIACAPRVDGRLEFHLHHPPKNLQAVDLLRLADATGIWQLSGPYGNCTVTQLHPTNPIIFIARNTGFASVKAVIEALLLANTTIPIYLYWCLPQKADFYLSELIAEWQRKGVFFKVIYTKTFLEYSAANQHLLQEYVIPAHPDFSHLQAYVSGPKPFVADIFNVLKERGLKEELFFSDLK